MNREEAISKSYQLISEARELAKNYDIPLVYCFGDTRAIAVLDVNGSARHALEVLDKEITQ